MHSWESIEPASPAALTAAQYDSFLRGEKPIANTAQTLHHIEGFGADLEHEA
jgi:hypothetical protein